MGCSQIGSSVMKTPRVEDFDPGATKKLPDMGMEMLPRIEKPAPTNPVTHPKVEKEQHKAPIAGGDTTVSRNHDTMPPRHHDTIITLIRKAVRQFGKEAATHRFTMDEKRAIADIIYTYARQGIRTSENEMARIAINFLIHDYRENGSNSVLEKVLRELNE